MFRKLYAVSLLTLSTIAYADFCPCPSSFNLIHMGDPLAQVLKSCCAPAHKKTYKKEPPVPQDWVYSIPAPPNPGNATQGSVILLVRFDDSGKIYSMNVNAQTLESTNCSNTATVSFDVNTPNTIQVGDSMEKVKTICGKPKSIQKGLPTEDNTVTPTITELQYAGPPPVTLIFENATLTQIQK